ncbi:MAG: hypothetical protein WC701_00555 [Kiritimatiellales bacterium]|jgi:hypothetical protein
MNKFIPLALALFIGGCSDPTTRLRLLDETTFDSEALRSVEKETLINLPNESCGLKMWHYTDFNPRLLAKIDIPPSSQDTLIKQIEQISDDELAISDPFTGELFSNPLWETLDWWKISPETIIFKKSYMDKRNYCPTTIFLCKENERVTLYIDRGSP